MPSAFLFHEHLNWPTSWQKTRLDHWIIYHHFQPRVLIVYDTLAFSQEITMKMVNSVFSVSRYLLVSFLILVGLQLRSLGGIHYPSSNNDRHDYDSPQLQHNTQYKDTFSIMKQGGYTNNTASNLTIDALSIGTRFNLKLLHAQSNTWARHHSIRHYFAATEKDDADPSCFSTLNKTTIERIVETCNTKQPLAKPPIKYQFRKSFSAQEFMHRGAGWMCAQQRFGIAVETLSRYYRNSKEALPDFLLIQDDDTYYNMVRIEEFLQDKDPSIPLAEAPCLIRHTKLVNLSFPWGGVYISFE